jgi:hypothetical protein
MTEAARLAGMHAAVGDGDAYEVQVWLSQDEAITLHELIARAEWASEFGVLEIGDEVEREVLSRLQMVLQPLIPGLGTQEHGASVRRARDALKRASGSH